ncbi:MAG: nuclear transport factor 2 family protein [Solirubrobacterales bacterium]
MSQENVEVIRGMLAAFNRGDVVAVIAAFDRDCALDEPWEMPDSPRSGFRGHDGVRDWMTNLREVVGVRFEALGFTTIGDVIVGEFAARGLGQASGVPVEWTTFAVVRMRDRKIMRAQAFLTKDEAVQAAGLPE